MKNRPISTLIFKQKFWRMLEQCVREVQSHGFGLKNEQTKKNPQTNNKNSIAKTSSKILPKE